MPVVLEFGREHPSCGGVDGMHARAVAQTPGDVWLIQESLRRYTVEETNRSVYYHSACSLQRRNQRLCAFVYSCI